MRQALQRFGRNYIVHGLVGAVLALPAFFISAAVVALLHGNPVVFWITICIVPLMISILLYRFRSWLLEEEPGIGGYAAYAIPGVSAAFIALKLATRIAPMVGSQSIVVATILSGVFVGLVSLLLDRALSNLGQLGRTSRP